MQYNNVHLLSFLGSGDVYFLVFCFMCVVVKGARSLEKTPNLPSTQGYTRNLVKTGLSVSEEKSFNGMILYM